MSAKPTAEIDLVNLAYMQIRQGEVTSLLDTNDPQAQLASKLVAPVRRGLLRSSTLWNFAKKRYSAPLVVGTTPDHDFDSFYQLPNDLLRLHKIGETTLDGDEPADLRYDIEGRYLCLDGTESSVPITYTRDEEDINKWDALFTQAFILELAIWLCMPVTGDLKMQMGLRARLTEMLAEAVTVDLQEKPLDIIDNSRPQVARDNSDSMFSDLGVTVSWP